MSFDGDDAHFGFVLCMETPEMLVWGGECRLGSDGIPGIDRALRWTAELAWEVVSHILQDLKDWASFS